MIEKEITHEPPTVSIPEIEDRFKKEALKRWKSVMGYGPGYNIDPNDVVCQLGWQYESTRMGDRRKGETHRHPLVIAGEVRFRLFPIDIRINFGEIIPNAQMVKRAVSTTLKHIRPAVEHQHQEAPNFTMNAALAAAMMTSLHSTHDFIEAISYPINRRVKCRVTPIDWRSPDIDKIQWRGIEDNSFNREGMRMPGKRILCDEMKLGTSEKNTATHDSVRLNASIPDTVQTSMIGESLAKLVNLPAYQAAQCQIKEFRSWSKDSVIVSLKSPVLDAHNIWHVIHEMEHDMKEAMQAR